MTTFTHLIHDTNFKGTFAINLPSKVDLERLFTSHSNALLVSVGHSVVHHLDRFDRKVGREVSQATMDLYPAELMEVTISGIKHIYRLVVTPKSKKPSKNPVTFVVGLSTVAESNVVRLLYVETL